MYAPKPKEQLEQGDPAEDPRAFRNCLGQYATGVAVITAKSANQRVGVTVNSFASLSLDPPLVLWSINKNSRSFKAFAAAENFVIHILDADQVEIARHFSGREADKFSGREFMEAECGSPLLGSAIAYFHCKHEKAYDGGDHVILVGRVTHFARFSGEPLLFVQGQYAVGSEHPGLAKSDNIIEQSSTHASAGTVSALSLLFRAHYYLSAAFDAHRREEGLNSVPLVRVLICIHTYPGTKIEDVVRKTYLGEGDAEDAIAGLIARSLLMRGSDGSLTLTEEGKRVRQAIRMRWEEFQRNLFAGIPERDLTTFKRVLSAITVKPARFIDD